MPLELLAGPILRRVEPERVCVWFATRAPHPHEVHILKVDRREASFAPLGSAAARVVTLGANLHVHLAEVNPAASGGFPTDRLLAYDIVDRGSATGDSLHQIAADHGLTYGSASLPTFVIQRTTPLRVVYASCRKLHGPVGDATVQADALIASTAAEIRNRPQALFLGGDQIYADDVADEVIGTVTKLAVDLIGHAEKIPGIPGSLPVGGRQSTTKRILQFTSDEATNHVMTFGEYAALYLLAWNDQNWPAGGVATTRSKHAVELAEYPTAVRRFRRVLANTPTYMIFDDHDVTDDWNICPAWSTAVRRSPAGTRVQANALAAFWAFQAWGNDPPAWDATWIRTVEAHLGKPAPQTGGQTSAGQQFDETMIGRQDWSFLAPTRPPTYFLDCRTMRGVGTHGLSRPPARLVGKEVWARARKALTASPGFRPGGPLVLVIPSPVFGVRHIEHLQEAAVRWGLATAYGLDLESWSAEPQNIADLVELLRAVKADPCVVLSGDVHYAATASVTLRFPPADSSLPWTETLRIAQFTSSAAKNNSGPLKYLQRGPGAGSLLTVRWWRDPATGRVSTEARGAAPTTSASASAFGLAGVPVPPTGQPRPPRAPFMDECYQLSGGWHVMRTATNIGIVQIEDRVVRNHYRSSTGQTYLPTEWNAQRSWPTDP